MQGPGLKAGGPPAWIERYAALAVVAFAVGLTLSGCGGPDNKVVVTGTVTYNGQQVTNGDIRFFPRQGTKGASSGAPIVDGQFEAGYRDGVPLGKHRVEIRAFALEGIGPATGNEASLDDDLLSGPAPKRRSSPLPVYKVEGRDQFLPPSFNTNSKLMAEVTGDDNPQRLDFELK